MKKNQDKRRESRVQLSDMNILKSGAGSSYGRFALLLVFQLVLSAQAFAASKLAEDHRGRLIFAIDLVRHGDRNPIAELPSLPHPWKGGLGALTEAGAQRALRVGETLRKEYVGSLLPEDCSPAMLQVRSTETSRTQRTAESILEGLYPSSRRNGQSIPVEVIKRSEDTLLIIKPGSGGMMGMVQNVVNQIPQSVYKRKLYSERIKKVFDLPSLEKASGMTLADWEAFGLFADNLEIRKDQGIPIPTGISSELVGQIVKADYAAEIELFSQDAVSGGGVARLAAEMKKQIELALAGGPVKHILWVGHDSTLMAAMMALGVPVKKWPGFAARLNVSVWKKGAALMPFIQASIDGDAIVPPRCSADKCGVGDVF